jgi:iron complex transport system substrate-binding protein
MGQKSMLYVGIAIGLIALLVASSGLFLQLSALQRIEARIDTLEQELTKPKILYALKDALNKTIVVIPRGAEMPPGIPDEWTVVRSPPERIASFAPSITATLFKIGLGDKVVVVTKWDEWPPEVVEKKRRGLVTVLESIVEPEVEKVMAARPELILTIKMRPEKLKKFEELGVPVVVIDYGDSVDSILRAIILLGRVTGAETKAQTLAIEIRNNITRIAQKVSGAPRPKVFWLVWHKPLMTAGGPSFITALIEAAGGTNIFADIPQPWPIISKEELIARNPDVIILTESFRESGINSVDDFLKLYPELKDLKAIRDNKFFFVSDAAVQPGPRTAWAVEQIARLLHPQLFAVPVPIYATH